MLIAHLTAARWLSFLISAFVAGAQTVPMEPLDRTRPVGPGKPSHGGFALVGGMSPFPADCNGRQTGSNYRNAPVEPSIAVDPHRPAHLVAAWQQDRWTDGGASGNASAVSMDGGHTWTTSLARFSVCGGGIWQRASDPWVAISPDGTAYQAALVFDTVVSGSDIPSAILVSRSPDGGLNWDEPITVVRHDDGGDDKEAITADPNDSRYLYLIWDRFVSATSSQPVWFSRTTDGGATWDPARIIYDPGRNGIAGAHQIAVLPDGTLLDVFSLSVNGSAGQGRVQTVAILRSSDHGATWSTPITLSTQEYIGTVDVKNQAPIRTGPAIPNVAVDGVAGAAYVVWPDARFSGHQRDGIAFSKSLDGGLTWSAAVQVNQAPNVQAFTPAIAVNAAGAIGVTYYDFRKDTNDPKTLFASYWRIVSRDGGATWREISVADPFDLLTAPLAAGAPFLGDYQGLVASGDLFVAFYIAANSGNTANPTSVFANSLERAGDTNSNLRTEINLHPLPMSDGKKREPDRRHQ